MSLFEATQVYAVETAGEAGGWVSLSQSDVQLDIDEIISCQEDTLRPLYVTGLRQTDFAITVDI